MIAFAVIALLKLVGCAIVIAGTDWVCRELGSIGQRRP